MALTGSDFQMLGNNDIEVGEEVFLGYFTWNGTRYKRYFKAIEFGALTASTAKQIALPSGITQPNIISIEGIAYRQGANASYTIPIIYSYSSSSDKVAGNIAVYINTTTIFIYTFFTDVIKGLLYLQYLRAA